jgi:hypothetical protein
VAVASSYDGRHRRKPTKQPMQDLLVWCSMRSAIQVLDCGKRCYHGDHLASLRLTEVLNEVQLDSACVTRSRKALVL